MIHVFISPKALHYHQIYFCLKQNNKIFDSMTHRKPTNRMSKSVELQKFKTNKKIRFLGYAKRDVISIIFDSWVCSSIKFI